MFCLAKQIIRNALRASENDAVIFCGSGATGGIQLLISAMALQTPPVVFIGPYEHHSAELPWINAKAHIVRIQEGQDGQPDYNHLEIALEQWSKTGITDFFRGSTRHYLGSKYNFQTYHLSVVSLLRQM